jgi:hypothetical protein
MFNYLNIFFICLRIFQMRTCWKFPRKDVIQNPCRRRKERSDFDVEDFSHLPDIWLHRDDHIDKVFAWI